MTPRMPICDPRAQPAITITKARPHSHDIHAAMLELGHRSAPPEHSCHRNADIALAEASSLLNTRPVTASALLSTIRLPNLATCTRLEASSSKHCRTAARHLVTSTTVTRSTACVAPATDMHMSGLATSPARLAARARTHPAHAHARSSATVKGLPPRTFYDERCQTAFWGVSPARFPSFEVGEFSRFPGGKFGKSDVFFGFSSEIPLI